MRSILWTLVAVTAVQAHPGKRNASGCHRHAASGTYHCLEPSSGSRPEPRTKGRRTTSDTPGSCGGKTRCGDMTSCAEAYHYLNVCGLQRLDRDRDGVPCESICE